MAQMVYEVYRDGEFLCQTDDLVPVYLRELPDLPWGGLLHLFKAAAEAGLTYQYVPWYVAAERRLEREEACHV